MLVLTPATRAAVQGLAERAHLEPYSQVHTRRLFHQPLPERVLIVPHGHRVTLFDLQHGVQPTKERRRRVVRVPFERRCDTEQDVVVNGFGHTLEQPESRNGCGSAAAKTGRHRNVALDLDLDRRRPNTRPPRDSFEGALDRVLSSDLWSARRYGQSRRAVIANTHDARAQIQLNGDTERIEAATEIGDRTRHHHFAPDCRGRTCTRGLK